MGAKPGLPLIGVAATRTNLFGNAGRSTPRATQDDEHAAHEHSPQARQEQDRHRTDYHTFSFPPSVDSTPKGTGIGPFPRECTSPSNVRRASVSKTPSSRVYARIDSAAFIKQTCDLKGRRMGLAGANRRVSDAFVGRDGPFPRVGSSRLSSMPCPPAGLGSSFVGLWRALRGPVARATLFQQAARYAPKRRRPPPGSRMAVAVKD